jgi:hypothetical protein
MEIPRRARSNPAPMAERGGKTRLDAMNNLILDLLYLAVIGFAR